MFAKSSLDADQHPWRCATLACLGLALGFASLVTCHVLFEVYLDCHYYYDLGIYSEALAKLGLSEPNPYLTARQLSIFSDHFDPILWLAVPFAHLLPTPYAGVCFESAFVFLGVVPFFVLAGRKALSLRAACLLSLLSLFNPGVMTALHYPIHPTAWAMTPWIWMVVALDSEAVALCLAAFVALLACKEEFPFVAAPLAWVLWQRSSRRGACWALALAAAWLAFVYGVRPRLVGPIMPYYSAPFGGLSDGLWTFLGHRLSAEDMYVQMGLCAVAFAPLTLWLWRKRFGPDRGYLFLCAPPMLIRFLHSSWRHQYHAVTMAAVVVSFLPALKKVRVPRGLIWCSCVALVGVNATYIGQAYKFARRESIEAFDYCPADGMRQGSLAQARGLLSQDANARMLVAMNLAAKLVDLPHVYLLDARDQNDAPPYRYVFFEKPPHGAQWPTTYARIQQAQDIWRAQPGTEMLVDDAWVFCARGAFYDTGP